MPQRRRHFCELFFLFCSLISICLTPSAWGAGQVSLQISSEHNSAYNSPVKFKPKIAIIIDDLGYNLKLGHRAVALDGEVTLAILPHTPHSVTLAKLGSHQNKEIMLHAPMSSILDKPLDPGGLTPDMEQAQLVSTLRRNLAALPNVVGINNHMGSQLTQIQQPMSWIMQELQNHDLYFVDSRTIASSVAWETALAYQVPTTRRDIFLDHDKDPKAIAEQYNKLLTIAHRHGQAIAIAHPYPETIAFLEAALPLLANAGVELVPVSALVSTPNKVTQVGTVKNFLRVDHPKDVVGLLDQTNY